MKRFFAFLLIVLIAISLVGCNSNNSPFTKSYKVSFETNGGDSIRSQYSSSLSSAPTPRRYGYLFDGWYRDSQLNVSAIFPLSLENDTTLYAKWLKIQDQTTCKSVDIKNWNGHSSSVLYKITPSGFDIDELAKRGYKFKIKVTYTVKYEKDYDALWDIGYAGSPKYEVSIYNSKYQGQFKYDLDTSTKGQIRTIEYQVDAVDLRNDVINLVFSTDNIQNVIYFYDISVTYDCVN